MSFTNSYLGKFLNVIFYHIFLLLELIIFDYIVISIVNVIDLIDQFHVRIFDTVFTMIKIILCNLSTNNHISVILRNNILFYTSMYLYASMIVLIVPILIVSLFVCMILYFLIICYNQMIKYLVKLKNNI